MSAIDPMSVAFRNAPQSPADGGLPSWGPTGEASPDDINRFQAALGDIGDARPVERLWDIARDWNAGVKEDVLSISRTMANFDNISIQELLKVQIQVHSITMAQSLMAKAGATVNETSQALLRGQ